MGRIIFGFLILFSALFTGCSIQAADVPALVLPPESSAWLTGLLMWAVGQYPGTVTALLVMGLLRLLLKPAFAWLHTTFNGHPAQLALIEKAENSRALAVLFWALDWATSIKVIPQTPMQRIIATVEQRAAGVFPALGFAVASLMLFAGCAGLKKTVVTTDPVTHVSTTNQVFDVSRITNQVETVAREGTRLPLIEDPSLRGDYQSALDELNALEAQPDINFSMIVPIIEKLPLKSLQSRDAQLIIEGGTVLLTIVDSALAAEGKTVPLEAVNDTHAIVTALRRGVESGLASTAP